MKRHLLDFSGEEDDGTDGDDDGEGNNGVVFYPRLEKTRVKDPPPRFKGDPTKFIQWSEEFVVCFRVR